MRNGKGRKEEKKQEGGNGRAEKGEEKNRKAKTKERKKEEKEKESEKQKRRARNRKGENYKFYPSLRPAQGFLATKKISRPARDSLTTNKPLARLGTLLPQKNLPPGAGSSCHRKIFRQVQGFLATKKSPARTDGRFFSNSRQSASGHLITVRRSHISWPFPTSGWL